MAWTKTDPMNERVKLIAACLAREESDDTLAELCARFGIVAKIRRLIFRSRAHARRTRAAPASCRQQQ